MGGASGEWVQKAESRASGWSASSRRMGGEGGVESKWVEEKTGHTDTDPKPARKMRMTTTPPDGFTIRPL